MMEWNDVRAGLAFRAMLVRGVSRMASRGLGCVRCATDTRHLRHWRAGAHCASVEHIPCARVDVGMSSKSGACLDGMQARNVLHWLCIIQRQYSTHIGESVNIALAHIPRHRRIEFEVSPLHVLASCA